MFDLKKEKLFSETPLIFKKTTTSQKNELTIWMVILCSLSLF